MSHCKFRSYTMILKNMTRLNITVLPPKKLKSICLSDWLVSIITLLYCWNDQICNLNNMDLFLQNNTENAFFTNKLFVVLAIWMRLVRWKGWYARILYCTRAQYSTVPCSAMQCSAVQCSAVQCSAVQCSAVQCSAVQYISDKCWAV